MREHRPCPVLDVRTGVGIGKGMRSDFTGSVSMMTLVLAIANSTSISYKEKPGF